MVGYKVDIDFESMQRMMKQFTEKQEIAKFFMCTEKDLDNFVKHEIGCTYAELEDHMHARGRAIIKNHQFEMAKKDSKVAMRLGEIYCGQKSENDIERIVIVNDLEDEKA